MNKGRQINKQKLCKQHRQIWYERSLDRLMTGKAKPGDVTLRYNKLKEVK